MQHMKTLLKTLCEGTIVVVLGVAVILGIESVAGVLIQILRGQ